MPKKENKLIWPRKGVRIYWEAYGGWHALIWSIYFMFAVGFTVLVVLFGDDGFSWSDTALSVIPDVLGFTLGGYVIMVGFGDTDFLEALRGRDESGPSPYMKVNTAFVHFIIVQTITLLVALLATALGIDDVWLVTLLGTFLLLYTAATILAATFAVLTVANWYDQKPKDSSSNS